MPRTKDSRNPVGTILKKKVTKNGKIVDAWDVRKRVKKLDEFGEISRDKNGKVQYQDFTERCYSYQAAINTLNNMPTRIEEDRQKIIVQKQEITREKSFFELCDYFEKNYLKESIYVGGKKVGGYAKKNIPHMRTNLETMKEFFGDVPLSSIKYTALVSFADKLNKTPTEKKDKQGKFKLPTGSTINKRLGFLRHLFNIAIDDLDWLIKSPFKRGPSLIHKTAEKERSRIMSFDEERKILEMCEEPKRKHLKFFVIIAVDTAMRRDEIYQLQWWQVDFDNRVIFLTEEAAKNSKTGAEGVLPMTQRVYDILMSLNLSTSLKKPNDVVFGRILFKRSWHYVLDKLGIEDLQFRDLRATAITRMLNSGSSGDIVKKVSRHSKNTEVFQKHYTRIDLQSAQEIGQKLEDFNQIHQDKVKVKVEVKNQV